MSGMRTSPVSGSAAALAVPVPKLIQIEVTRACNLRCIHCGINQVGYPFTTMSYESFEKVVPFLRRHRPTVELSGHGESMIAKRFFDMLELVVDAGCPVSFFTNAMGLTPEVCERLLDLAGEQRLAHLTVSIDAAERELFEIIRRRASFDTFVGNLEALNEGKQRRGLGHPVVSFNMVAMLMNVHQLADVVRLVHRLGGSELVIVDLLEYEFFKDQKLALDPQMARPHVDEAIATAAEIGLPFTVTPELVSVLGLPEQASDGHSSAFEMLAPPTDPLRPDADAAAAGEERA